ncbi:peptidylprolyl isomerase [Prolixibacteraceae bacterium JC049]|nr:peptidylprolyl isomerase [Prolixibacteraceae bacterium JC049]
MATLERIRNRAGLLVAIIIGLALVAFILGDMLRSGSSILRSSQLEIAEIDGETVQYPDFQRKVDEMVEIYKMNTGRTALDDATMTQVRENTFQTLVRELIMTKVFDNLGVAVSTEELNQLVQGDNPHQLIRQVFRNPQTGEFNKSMLINFLKNREFDPSGRQAMWWKYMEDQIYNERMTSKYNTMLAKGLYTTKAEAEKNLKAQNHKVNIEFVQQSFNTIADSLVKVSDADLKKYYEAHKDDYKQSESRRIEYVSFDVIPSADDDKATEKYTNELKADFAKATDNVQFVNLNSDVNFANTFSKKEELPTAMSEWAFASEEGAIYGPYKENNSWKLAKINSFKHLPDSVKASHILIQPKTQAEVAAAEATVDSLKTLVKKGANFAKLAKKFSADKGSAAKGGDLGWFKRNQMVKPFELAAFGAKKGEVVVARTQFGIHLIKVNRVGKTTKQVQLAVLERKIEASSQTYQNIYQAASKFASENTTKADFDKAIADQKLAKRVATVRKADRMVNGMDGARMLVRGVYDAELGAIVKGSDESPIYEIGDSFIIAALSNITPEGIAPLAEVKARVELQVKKDKKAEMLKAKMANKTDLAQLASTLNTEVKTADNLTFNSFSVPGVGMEPAIVGWSAFAAKDKVSTPLKGNNGVYVVKVTAINDGTKTDVKETQGSLNRSLASRANYQAYQALKSNTEVVDNRTRFY